MKIVNYYKQIIYENLDELIAFVNSTDSKKKEKVDEKYSRKARETRTGNGF
jgi:hypothetical protein